MEENVFDVKSMEKKIIIGGKTLTIAPLKLKSFRRFIGTIDEGLKSIQRIDPKSSNMQVVDALLKCAGAILSVLFPIDEYPFMTEEFIEENVSIPIMREILEQSVIVNKIEDLFPFLKTKTPVA